MDSLSVLGVAFALMLFILTLSAIILYLAFRIKEVFREERKRGMLVVKIAFLIGILFLAGGSFYFFGKVLTSPSNPTPAPTTTPLQTPTPVISPTPTLNETVKPQLTLIISYPSKVRMQTEITISFTITNPTEYTAHGVTIQTNILFEYFNLLSSTHEVIGNVIKIGEAPSGTVICSLKLASPRKPGQFHDMITLTFQEMDQPISREIEISVTGKV